MAKLIIDLYEPDGAPHWLSKPAAKPVSERSRAIIARVDKAKVKERVAANARAKKMGSVPVHVATKRRKTTAGGDCGANAPGGGGFQVGNDCARNRLATSEPENAPKTDWSPGEEEQFQRYRKWRDAREAAVLDKFKSGIDSAGDNLTRERQAAYREAAQQVVSALSDAQLRRLEYNLEGVVFYESAERMTEVTVGKEAMIRDPSLRVGGCWQNSGWMLLDGGMETDPLSVTTREVYAHEVSHGFDKSLPTDENISTGTVYRPGVFASATREWIDAWRAEIDLPDSPLSKYARQNNDEGFAEFGRLYLTQPKVARELFPKCTAAWEQLGIIPPRGAKPWANF